MTAEEQQKEDEMYMRKALAEAEEAFKAGEIPVGAVIVLKILQFLVIPLSLHQHQLHLQMLFYFYQLVSSF